MSSKVKDLFEQACDLSEKERATLAGLLIESLETEWDTGVDDSWPEEIRRRMAEIDSGEVETVPWEAVRERLVSALDDD